MDSSKASIQPPVVWEEELHNEETLGSPFGAPINVGKEAESVDKNDSKQGLPRRISSINLYMENPAGDDDKIRLGICAMDKKARSKPMAEILSRLDDDKFQVVFFGDDTILNKEVEEWPFCHVLIAFFSKGYPLNKANKYVELRKPFVINDLSKQEVLKDRRKVYDLLEASGIDVPRHVYLSKDNYISTGTGDGNGSRDREVLECDDHIEVNGVRIEKPFVEKPVDADDHNIAIYYPTSAGGGCKKLFRKIGNRSSEFYPDINEVRRDGSYIYEEFVETQGTDVKMYSVGPEYGHAEARKSPTVDGKVERNSNGKEVRFPVILSMREKEISRRIVLVFKQFVCGFDLLRVQKGHSVVPYVCDVNGFSFVKTSRKYYDDCAQILQEHMLAAVKPGSSKGFSTLNPLVKNVDQIEEIAPVAKNPSPQKERSSKKTVLSRATRMLQGEPGDDEEDDDNSRHSDDDGQLTAGSVQSPARSDTAAATLEDGALPISEIPDQLFETISPQNIGDEDLPLNVTPIKCRSRSGSITNTHQEELRCVIAVVRHGDRTPKQKLKVKMQIPRILRYYHDRVTDCRKDLKVKGKVPMTQFLETVKTILAEIESDEQTTEKKVVNNVKKQLMHMRDILERWKIVGLNRKLQIKPKKWEEFVDENGQERTRCTQVQLILKWGGNLTKLGEKQSIHLGQRLRQEMYPDAPGGGILRLHSTFRHDLKIKTSDEGRVMKTAAAFAKGMLELEGDLPPILVSLVHKEKGSMHMLDPSGNKEVKMELDVCKENLTANLQKDIDVDAANVEERERLVGPVELTGLHDALLSLRNPRQTLLKIHSLIGELIEQLEEMLESMGSGDERRIEGGEGLAGDHEDDVALSGIRLYKGETLLELTERWRFLYTNLYDSEKNEFDLSRIPDVHDNVRFDVLHNPHLGLTTTLERLYVLAKNMADCVVPQEYGTTIAEKRSVGVKISKALLEKLKYDLKIARTDNEVDMRYMINMAYSTDLPINTMGRRIRTRLYFTSESHLHTLLNILRFAGDKASILSEQGISILNGYKELCYLTQVVIRLFEDPRREMSDPRRFRVEILCSPGATATPLHMHEDDRNTDASRFDTSPLQQIGKEYLTCQEVEEFFQATIFEGASIDDEDAVYDSSAESTKTIKRKHSEDISRHDNFFDMEPKKAGENSATETDRKEKDKDSKATERQSQRSSETNSDKQDRTLLAEKTKGEEIDEEKSAIERRRLLERKYFWGTVAAGSLMLAASCLGLAIQLSGDPHYRRRYSTRRF